MKKYSGYLIGLIISLLLEILVFNISSVTSLFNKEIDLSDKMYTEYTDMGLVAYITGLDDEIKNIYFDASMAENAPVDFDIAMTDEGNYYDYYFPTGTLYADTKASFYRNVHTYGKAHTMTITFKDGGSGFGLTNFVLNGIRLNVKRPLFFNIIRFLAVFLLISFFYALRSEGELSKIPYAIGEKSKRGKNQIIIAAVCIILVASLGAFWSGSHKLFDEASKPHHQQYKELVRSISEGEVSLPGEVPSELLNAPNPYDTIYLQANGIPYRADYAYFEGKYYVYFGIAPAVLLYLPYYAVTHKDLPNHYAVLLFYMGFVLGTFLLYGRVVKRYFEKIPFAAYLMLSAGTATCGTFAYLYFTADLYSVPVMAAMCFTFLGLYLWLLGQDTEKTLFKNLAFFLGSLCMALVAGSRPQFLIFSFVGILIFAKDIFGKNEKSIKDRIVYTLPLAIPYVVVAVGVMYYNYIRFGSVFDFGATYSLTNNDMNLRGFNLERILISVITFFFGMPKISGVFPFWHSASPEYSYLGRMVTEHFLGGIFITNITAVAVFLYMHYRKDIKGKGLEFLFVLLVGTSLITGVLDADKAGVLQRYMADMTLGIMTAASLVWATALEKGNKLTMNLLKALFVIQLFVTLFIICNTASGITLEIYNPELFGKIQSIFMF